jgi:hypothetical protein
VRVQIAASTSKGGGPYAPLLEKRAEVKDRVLVNNKGMGVLYKATILSYHKKAGKQEYKIHYDGNKKSTVHWIPVDQVNMLESEVDDKDPATVTTIVPNIDKDIVILSIGDRQNHFEYSESAESILLQKLVSEIIEEYLRL